MGSSRGGFNRWIGDWGTKVGRVIVAVHGDDTVEMQRMACEIVGRLDTT